MKEFLETKLFWGNTVYNFLIFVLLIIAIYLITLVLKWFFEKVLKKLAERTQTTFDDVLLNILQSPLKWLVIVVGVGFSLNILNLKGFGKYIKHGVLAISVFFITFFIVRSVHVIFDFWGKKLKEKEERVIDDQFLIISRKFIKVLIWIIALLLILSNLGYNITSLLTGLGIGGLAVALAAKDTLSNIFGSIAIFTDRPFKMGDWIKFEDYIGCVEEIGLRSVKIRLPDGFKVTAPNAKFMETPVINLSNGEKRRVELMIGVTYNTPVENLKKAKSIVENILTSTQQVLKEPKPLINFIEFAESSLNIQIYYWTVFPWEEYLATKDRVNMKIKEEFDKNGLNFAFKTITIDIPQNQVGLTP